MFPLVVSIARLLRKYPEGGFYTYAKHEINTFAGFFSGWCYFVSKLASATLVIHISVLLMQRLCQPLAEIPALALDALILAGFVGLNTLNIKTGSAIQSMFMGLKLIPVLFAIFVGLFLFSGSSITSADLLWSGLPGTLPLVLYAMLGFEAACSISSKIQDAEKNGPRAILISYGLVTLILVLYQTIFYGAIGSALGSLVDFRSAFPALVQKLTLSESAQSMLIGILHAAIAASALGGSYGIIFSNNWNLYVLAQHGHVFKSSLFTRLNKHNIPLFCVIAEGVVCAIYLLVTRGSQIPLQQIGALGSTITYMLSACSLVALEWSHTSHRAVLGIALLGVFNCFILIGMSIYNLVHNGAHSLILFTTFLLFGVVMYYLTKTPSKK